MPGVRSPQLGHGLLVVGGFSEVGVSCCVQHVDEQGQHCRGQPVANGVLHHFRERGAPIQCGVGGGDVAAGPPQQQLIHLIAEFPQLLFFQAQDSAAAAAQFFRPQPPSRPRIPAAHRGHLRHRGGGRDVEELGKVLAPVVDRGRGQQHHPGTLRVAG